MYLDFHTHGKLAKRLPFSEEYTHWLFSEAKNRGLDALCLTEHFNTLGFEEVYRYIEEHSYRKGDSLIFDGLQIFPGMEIDIAEGGHILCIGSMENILEINRRLKPCQSKGRFLPFSRLIKLLREYPVLVGGGHPFRQGGHIPELPFEDLNRLDFFDLNGKDVALDRKRTQTLTYALGKRLNKPVVGGSDTHQAVQYGCIRTCFERDISWLSELLEEMAQRNYRIEISETVSFQVRTAALLKRALKEIHALGGDYVSILLDGASCPKLF